MNFLLKQHAKKKKNGYLEDKITSFLPTLNLDLKDAQYILNYHGEATLSPNR